MKKLLFIVLLMPLGLMAQITFSSKSQPDTVKCIMLVCDTSLQHYNNYDCANCSRQGYNPMVTWQTGYCYYIDLIHVGYLDEAKKPLSKNIIVWMSQQTNK